MIDEKFSDWRGDWKRSAQVISLFAWIRIKRRIRIKERGFESSLTKLISVGKWIFLSDRHKVAIPGPLPWICGSSTRSNGAISRATPDSSLANRRLRRWELSVVWTALTDGSGRSRASWIGRHRLTRTEMGNKMVERFSGRAVATTAGGWPWRPSWLSVWTKMRERESSRGLLGKRFAVSDLFTVSLIYWCSPWKRLSITLWSICVLSSPAAILGHRSIRRRCVLSFPPPWRREHSSRG
jgi:hypothetical protein